MIREATHADLDAIVAMGITFSRESRYPELIGENRDQMRATAQALIDMPNGLMLVSGDSDLTGMIGVLISNHYVSGERFGIEVFWWVNPSSRGTLGIRLLKRAEELSKKQGAIYLQMIAPDPRVGMIYERLGYRPIETTYCRRLS